MADRTLRVTILGDADSARRAFGETEAAAGSLEAKVGGVGGALSTLGPVFAGIGLASAGIFAGAVSSAADFEQTMSNVSAVSGATGETFDQLRQLALDMGAQTSFSAGEAAQGLEELLKGGLDTEAAMAALKSTLDLAAAGEISVADAAAIAANAIAMFGLEGADMEMVANNIAGAANASSISVSDFRMSLAAVGAVANLAGQSFEDTATAIALMGAQGIKGADAGTSLKTMLMNLEPTTKSATEAFRQLGIITEDGTNKFINADGSYKSLAEISGILNEATRDLSESERAMALEMMFGSDAVRAAAIMANAGADGFNSMADAMGKVTAADVAAAKLDNLKGAIEALKGSMETIAIIVGSVFLPVLRELAEFLTAVANRFIELPQSVQTTIAVVTLVAGAFAGLIGVAVTFGPQILAIGQAFVFLAGVLSGPLLLAAAAAGALWLAWDRDFLGIRDRVTEAATAFGVLIAYVNDVVYTRGDLLNDTLGETPEAFRAIIHALADLQTVLGVLLAPDQPYSLERFAQAWQALPFWLQGAIQVLVDAGARLAEFGREAEAGVGAALRVLADLGTVLGVLLDPASPFTMAGFVRAWEDLPGPVRAGVTALIEARDTLAGLRPEVEAVAAVRLDQALAAWHIAAEALAPMIARVREVVVEALAPLDGLRERFDTLRQQSDPLAHVLGELSRYADELAGRVRELDIPWRELASAFSLAWTLAGPLVAVLGGPLTIALGVLAGAAFGLYQAWEENWLGVRDRTAEVAGWITEVAIPALRDAWDGFVAAFRDAQAGFAGTWDVLRDIFLSDRRRGGGRSGGPLRPGVRVRQRPRHDARRCGGPTGRATRGVGHGVRDVADAAPAGDAGGVGRLRRAGRRVHGRGRPARSVGDVCQLLGRLLGVGRPGPPTPPHRAGGVPEHDGGLGAHDRPPRHRRLGLPVGRAVRRLGARGRPAAAAGGTARHPRHARRVGAGDVPPGRRGAPGGRGRRAHRRAAGRCVRRLVGGGGVLHRPAGDHPAPDRGRGRHALAEGQGFGPRHHRRLQGGHRRAA